MGQGEAPSGLRITTERTGQNSHHGPAPFPSAIPGACRRRSACCEPPSGGWAGRHLDSTIPFLLFDFTACDYRETGVSHLFSCSAFIKVLIYRRAKAERVRGQRSDVSGPFPLQTCPFLQYPILISHQQCLGGDSPCLYDRHAHTHHLSVAHPPTFRHTPCRLAG